MSHASNEVNGHHGHRWHHHHDHDYDDDDDKSAHHHHHRHRHDDEEKYGKGESGDCLCSCSGNENESDNDGPSGAPGSGDSGDAPSGGPGAPGSSSSDGPLPPPPTVKADQPLSKEEAQQLKDSHPDLWSYDGEQLKNNVTKETYPVDGKTRLSSTDADTINSYAMKSGRPTPIPMPDNAVLDKKTAQSMVDHNPNLVLGTGDRGQDIVYNKENGKSVDVAPDGTTTAMTDEQRESLGITSGTGYQPKVDATTPPDAKTAKAIADANPVAWSFTPDPDNPDQGTLHNYFTQKDYLINGTTPLGTDQAQEINDFDNYTYGTAPTLTSDQLSNNSLTSEKADQLAHDNPNDFKVIYDVDDNKFLYNKRTHATLGADGKTPITSDDLDRFNGKNDPVPVPKNFQLSEDNATQLRDNNHNLRILKDPNGNKVLLNAVTGQSVKIDPNHTLNADDRKVLGLVESDKIKGYYPDITADTRYDDDLAQKLADANPDAFEYTKGTNGNPGSLYDKLAGQSYPVTNAPVGEASANYLNQLKPKYTGTMKTPTTQDLPAGGKMDVNAAQNISNKYPDYQVLYEPGKTYLYNKRNGRRMEVNPEVQVTQADFDKLSGKTN